MEAQLENGEEPDTLKTRILRFVQVVCLSLIFKSSILFLTSFHLNVKGIRRIFFWCEQQCVTSIKVVKSG